MTSVLVVDDQILVRAGLSALIRAAPGFEVVGEAAGGRQAIELAARLRPQVVLMDIRMPDIDGVAATARIVAGNPPAPRVLVLTTFDLDEYIYAALRAGASGFLLKETPPERLLAAIRTVAEGDTLLTPSVTRRLVEAFVPPVRSGPQLTPLTARETEILRLVGTGRTNAAIAAALVVSEATVKTHLARLMSKLALSSRAQVVVTAYETGLIVPGRAGPRTD
uniref:response regulator n=1 Tax=Paractinoplanes polyasparticus TaxID=2856853 RepID=UPI001C86053F|nr:response regulator transcription factor [Actinoplanes polyasparticus]